MASELFRRKEVAQIFGVIPHTIFFWEKKGIITPVGYINGRPVYTLQEVQRVAAEKQMVFVYEKPEPHE